MGSNKLKKFPSLDGGRVGGFSTLNGIQLNSFFNESHNTFHKSQKKVTG